MEDLVGGGPAAREAVKKLIEFLGVEPPPSDARIDAVVKWVFGSDMGTFRTRRQPQHHEKVMLRARIQEHLARGEVEAAQRWQAALRGEPLSGVRGEITQERANNTPQREEPEPASTKDDGRPSGGGATENGETANEAAVTGRYGKWRSELRDAHREWFHVIEGQVSAGLKAFGYRLAAAETAQPAQPHK
jgi:hypothetical protein